ncbi:hypothetical protein [Acrocarpospora catenulata]|uniref:hypothetical protein n=1 Tax=Acrocarpospora catenulata TaxID=2836182 RepID=UPI001BD9828F|nr:hypothetical protein [Acrocarpospora catenulata]
MGIFRKRPQQATPGNTDLPPPINAREQRVDRWRKERLEKAGLLDKARKAHAGAQGIYNMYAPGSQKDKAGAQLNAAADALRDAQAAFEAVNQYSDWDKAN